MSPTPILGLPGLVYLNNKAVNWFQVEELYLLFDFEHQTLSILLSSSRPLYFKTATGLDNKVLFPLVKNPKDFKEFCLFLGQLLNMNPVPTEHPGLVLLHKI